MGLCHGVTIACQPRISLVHALLHLGEVCISHFFPQGLSTPQQLNTSPTCPSPTCPLPHSAICVSLALGPTHSLVPRPCQGSDTSSSPGAPVVLDIFNKDTAPVPTLPGLHLLDNDPPTPTGCSSLAPASVTPCYASPLCPGLPSVSLTSRFT